jgi:hypothetical protein
MIEVYWPTGAHGVRQPYLEPLDLNESDEALMKQLSQVTA